MANGLVQGCLSVRILHLRTACIVRRTDLLLFQILFLLQGVLPPGECVPSTSAVYKISCRHAIRQILQCHGTCQNISAVQILPCCFQLSQNRSALLQPIPIPYRRLQDMTSRQNALFGRCRSPVLSGLQVVLLRPYPHKI